MKNGKKLIGPELRFDKNAKQIEITSRVFKVKNYKADDYGKPMTDYVIYLKAVIEIGESGKTECFVNGKVVKTYPFVDRRMLDWIMQSNEKKNIDSTVMMKEEGGDFIFGESRNNLLTGRGIEICRGTIYI